MLPCISFPDHCKVIIRKRSPLQNMITITLFLCPEATAAAENFNFNLTWTHLPHVGPPAVGGSVMIVNAFANFLRKYFIKMRK